MKLLLDTCTFLWMLTGEHPLSARATAAIRTGDVSLSVVSAWEIAVKYGRGQLRLSEPPERLLPAARARYHFRTLPLDEESALHVVKLPSIHQDPFDRMLVSQAIVHGLTIVTSDAKVTEYPARTLW